jgi:hypothetical protein
VVDKTEQLKFDPQKALEFYKDYKKDAKMKTSRSLSEDQSNMYFMTTTGAPMVTTYDMGLNATSVNTTLSNVNNYTMAEALNFTK